MESKQRLEYIDSAKAIAIILGGHGDMGSWGQFLDPQYLILD